MNHDLNTFNRRALLVGVAGVGVGTIVATNPLDAWAATTNDRAWKWFRSKGLAKHQVAGIMGNFIYESGRNPMNPEAKQTGGSAIGIAQWDGSRKQDLINFAKARDLPWDDMGVQLRFTWHELTSTERRSLDRLKATKNARDAAISFCDNFERPGVHRHERRIEWAEKVYKNRA